MASPRTFPKRTGQQLMERALVQMSDRAAQPLTFGSQSLSPTSFFIRIGPTSEALFCRVGCGPLGRPPRSEEHTSELQSHLNLVCRLLLEKKKQITHPTRMRPAGAPTDRCDM